MFKKVFEKYKKDFSKENYNSATDLIKSNTFLLFVIELFLNDIDFNDIEKQPLNYDEVLINLMGQNASFKLIHDVNAISKAFESIGWTTKDSCEIKDIIEHIIEEIGALNLKELKERFIN
jgi:hypothetical protein